MIWEAFFMTKRKMCLQVFHGQVKKVKSIFLTRNGKKFMTGLRKKFEGYEVDFTGRDDEMKKLIVSLSSDRLRVKYLIYDVASKEAVEISNPYPWLNEEDMAVMKPISYTSRDGLTINGYLTLPKGIEPKNLPVVVNPHGGPWARDVWGFNPEVQFLGQQGLCSFADEFQGKHRIWQKVLGNIF